MDHNPEREQAITSLFDEIFNSTKYSNESDKYIPRTKLEELVSETAVKNVLKHYSLEQLHCQDPDASQPEFSGKLAKFVVDSAVKIFATLIMIGKPWVIGRFYNSNVQQDVLPLEYKPKSRGSREWVVQSMKKEHRGRVEVGTVLPPRLPPDYWEPKRDNDNFCKNQWMFLAPVFNSQEFYYELERHIPIPYVDYDLPDDDKLDTRPQQAEDEPDAEHHEEYKPGRGGFSVVDQMAIHADHMILIKGQTTAMYKTADGKEHYRVAVKRLKENDRKKRAEMARNEAKILKTVRDDLKNDHLIKAIVYFEKAADTPEHTILFPYAEGGDLTHFWADKTFEKDTTARDHPEFLTWVFKQLAGLTGAVAMMHHEKHNIRHGDLKPDNILCFHDTSQSSTVSLRLVITDVGIAKAHLESTTARKKKRLATSTVVSTTRYAAPEFKAVVESKSAPGKNDPKQLPRLFDVWSLGCIFMEFLIWLLYGLKFQVAFNNMTGGDEFHDEKGTVVRKEVTQWLSYMENDGRCSKDTASRGLLDLIRERLLIVHVKSLQDEPPPPEVSAASKSTSPAPAPSPATAKKSSWKIWRKPAKSSNNRNPGGPVQTPKPDDSVPSKTSTFRANAKEAANSLEAISLGLQPENKSVIPLGVEADETYRRGPPWAPVL